MKTPTRVLIVEDEFLIAMDLRSRLEAMDFWVTGVAASYEQALEQALQHNPDVVVMDIQLEGAKTGIDAAKLIWSKLEIPVIFLTGMQDPETVEAALATQPMGYVYKPFKDAELRNQIWVAVQQKEALRQLKMRLKNAETQEKIGQTEKATEEYVFIKDNRHIYQVPVADILYLEAMDNYTVLHTVHGEQHIISGVLKDILEKMENPGLLRIHRSYAIARRHIRRIEENTVSMGERVLPVGKSFRDAFYASIQAI